MIEPIFWKLPLNDDPLRGAFGLSWFERKPKSLAPDEWAALESAVKAGKISIREYADWKEYVK